jgi:hypothetical protein
MGYNVETEEVHVVLVIFSKSKEVWMSADRMQKAKPGAVKRLGV